MPSEAVKRLQNFYAWGCLHEVFYLSVSLPRGRKLHASNLKLLQSCWMINVKSFTQVPLLCHTTSCAATYCHKIAWNFCLWVTTGEMLSVSSPKFIYAYWKFEMKFCLQHLSTKFHIHQCHCKQFLNIWPSLMCTECIHACVFWRGYIYLNIDSIKN